MRGVTHGAVLLGYSLITIAATWPLAANLGSAIGGETADPGQTLWGFWWWRHSADFGSGPMHTTFLWWPEGVPLWFQSWDIPSTLAAWPLWGYLPDVATYNLAVLATFPLSGFAVYLLSRELWGGRLAPFLAGCLYTFSTFHFAHARMQLHITSMEWSPLVFLALVRFARRQRSRDAVAAGLALALATLTSIYHLLFSVVGILVLTIVRPPADRLRLIAHAKSRHALMAAGVFAAAAGWLLVGMARSYFAEPYVGSHESWRFSADLQSFFVPNAISAWSAWFPVSGEWSGNPFETSAYVGYVALGLAVAGAWRSVTARRFVWLGLAGAILALGPFLRVGGSVPVPIPLPEGWLELLVPPLRMSGMPTRYSWMTTFGVSVAAGAALARLCRRGRPGAGLAIGLVAIAMVEVWPERFSITSWERPAIFAEWADDPGDWGVIDASSWSRGLWHQMAHHRPMVTGYTTRTPASVWNRVQSDPLLRPLLQAVYGPANPITVPADEARAALRRQRIRFVIVDEAETAIVAPLALAEHYRGGGIVIYAVD